MLRIVGGRGGGRGSVTAMGGGGGGRAYGDGCGSPCDDDVSIAGRAGVLGCAEEKALHYVLEQAIVVTL